MGYTYKLILINDVLVVDHLVRLVLVVVHLVEAQHLLQLARPRLERTLQRVQLIKEMLNLVQHSRVYMI